MEQKQWDEWCSEVSLTVNTYNDVLIMGMLQRFTSDEMYQKSEPIFNKLMRILRVNKPYKLSEITYCLQTFTCLCSNQTKTIKVTSMICINYLRIQERNITR
ncbi:Hypothetical_protein [Hexamita inflata]|uniref:Hypothetical_protein n=1 Tax=Hexamita inflata TaxID=28002 RepID=A0AA86U7K4_9EUKA|nr:Hypothetical protein HINF_LOCUS31904 [Hexamita inflata]